MVGRRFGRLTVLARANDRPSDTRRFCASCDCGAEAIVDGYALRRGTTQSCGCLSVERSTTHGEARVGARSAEYKIWCYIIKRCENQNDKNYGDYGGRGITVCEKWRRSYPAFLEDMGRRPSIRHSIDRIDNNRGYEPGNCRWATATQQARNRRPRRLLKNKTS
jgi:hypothetical protein